MKRARLKTSAKINNRSIYCHHCIYRIYNFIHKIQKNSIRHNNTNQQVHNI